MSINEVNAFEWAQNGVYTNYMRNLYETGRAVGPNTMVTAPSPEIGRDDSAQMSSETLMGDNGRKSPDSLLGAFATAWGKGVGGYSNSILPGSLPPVSEPEQPAAAKEDVAHSDSTSALRSRKLRMSDHIDAMHDFRMQSADGQKAAGHANRTGQGSGQAAGKTRGSGYYPHNSAMEGGYKDMRGKKLHTLQDFLKGKSPYVSIALDKNLYKKGSVKYGDTFRIPELEKKYGRPIVFKAVDTGGAFTNKGFSRVDICCGSRKDTLDKTINGKLSLVRG
jgi:hypothetical protein